MQIAPRESLDRIRLYVSLAGVSIEGAMSALGHKRTYAVQKGMSALPPGSDHESDFSQKPMSALTPKADVCSALVYVG